MKLFALSTTLALAAFSIAAVAANPIHTTYFTNNQTKTVDIVDHYGIRNSKDPHGCSDDFQRDEGTIKISSGKSRTLASSNIPNIGENFECMWTEYTDTANQDTAVDSFILLGNGSNTYTGSNPSSANINEQ